MVPHQRDRHSVYFYKNGHCFYLVFPNVNDGKLKKLILLQKELDDACSLTTVSFFLLENKTLGQEKWGKRYNKTDKSHEKQQDTEISITKGLNHVLPITTYMLRSCTTVNYVHVFLVGHLKWVLCCNSYTCTVPCSSSNSSDAILTKTTPESTGVKAFVG